MPKKMILASGSARRAQLLSDMGYRFEISIPDVDESLDPQLSIDENLLDLVSKKADVVLDSLDNPEDYIIVSGDTMVIFENQVLGKPADQNEAMEMISKLSDNKHHVSTAFCLKTSQQEIKKISTTLVYFDRLEPAEIQHYVEKYQPMDKAGAYGIQEWIGMMGIREIRGDYYTVMGLPCHDLYQSLKQDFNISPKDFN